VKMFIALALAGLLASTAVATVSVQVYRADEQTPLEWADPNIPAIYQDIMVGTRLTFFVVSDTAEAFWSGGLQLSWEDWNRGALTGREYDPNTANCDGCILPAAGPDAYFRQMQGDDARFSLSTLSAEAGEWFLFDYRVRALGACNIGLYGLEAGELPPGYDPSFGDPPRADYIWLQALSFNHVPTRDFDGDCVVNFADFALWANQWHQTIEADPNQGAADPNMAVRSDLNADDAVNVPDLTLFCNFWLDRPDVPEPAFEPNLPDDAL